MCWCTATPIKIAPNRSLFLECEIYNAILALSRIGAVVPAKDTIRHPENRGSLAVSLLSSIGDNSSRQFKKMPTFTQHHRLQIAQTTY
ncbi:unnamed protein product, partial [Vitis vinifera]